MWSPLDIFKNKTSRRVARTSVQGLAATFPTSGSASGQNSRGTSATSAEVLTSLDVVFNDIDQDGSHDFKSARRFIERTLSTKMSRYSNVGLVGLEESPPWQPDKDLLEMVKIALACSIHVYPGERELALPAGYKSTLVHSVQPSLNGVVKAVQFTCVEGASESQEKEDVPTLVVAICGTRPKIIVDWLANFNQQLRNVDNLLPESNSSLPLQGHSGFLNGYRAIIEVIATQIKACVASKSVRHVVFTGHSAGGAVASLAFLRALNGETITTDSPLRYSLITFGSPPVVSRLLKSGVDYGTNSTSVTELNFINEHDPVTRLDHDYVQSLIQLWNETPAKTLLEKGEQKLWTLPGPNLYHVGNLIVLSNHEDDEGHISAHHVSSQQLSSSIFYALDMHKKSEYLKNLTLIR